MEHATGTSPRTQRLIALVAMVVVALATALAFGRVFLGHGSTWRLMLVGVASAVLACAMERRGLLLATLVSAAGLACAIAWLLFPDTLWHGLPSLDTLRAAVEAAGQVGEQARVQVSPTPPLTPLFLAAVTSLWAAIFSSHALAFRAGSPLLALLPPIALVAFADTVLEESIRPWYGVLFLAAGLVVVFADSLRRVQGWGPVWVGPGSKARLSATASRGARRVAVAAVAVAALVPILVPGFGSAPVFDLSSTDPDQVGLNPLVSIGASLNRREPIDVFTVETDHPSYWRVVSLPDFDGTTWRPAEDLAGDPITSDSELILTTPETDTNQETFHVLAEKFQASLVPGIPIAYPPVSVDMGDASLAYDRESGTVLADGPLDGGTTYRIASLPVTATPAALGTEVLLTSAQTPRYTALPSDLPAGLAGLARAWTEGARNDYERVMAIQEHLADTETFTYDESVPRRDDSYTLLDFLTRERRGFCQQFASAMGVLLRTLGIPTRLVVGYTTGSWDPETHVATVTTDDAHVWVEVLFPSFGWLSFEPTPTRLNPATLAYTNPTVPCTAVAGGCGADEPSTPEGGLGSGSTAGQGGLPGQLRNLLNREGGAGPQVGSRAGPLPGIDVETHYLAVSTHRISPRAIVGWVVLGLAALYLLLVPPWRILRRRARLRKAGRAPRELVLAAYDVFTERAADLGYPRGPGETVEEYRRRLEAAIPPADGHLARLTSVTESAAYAPEPPGADQAARAADDASAAIRDLRRTTPFLRRMTGLYRRG
jgi:hypothetical protein